MNPGDIQAIEAQRQTLLTRLQAAEENVRAGLHHTQGFGSAARAHLERAQAHLAEAYIAINELKPVRSVQQLVDDLVRIEQVIEKARRHQSQRI
jgi:ABC-type transporter Mla subunit MlaD